MPFYLFHQWKLIITKAELQCVRVFSMQGFKGECGFIREHRHWVVGHRYYNLFNLYKNEIVF